MSNPMRIVTLGATAAAMLLPGAAALAHPHTAGPADQVIANGQVHPAFVDGESCESFGLPGGGDFDGSQNAAWYGLETAHHGPDQGEPGKNNGCYQLDDGVTSPGADDENPAID